MILSLYLEKHTTYKTQVWLSHFHLGHASFSLLKIMFLTMFEKLDIQSFHLMYVNLLNTIVCFSLQGIIKAMFHLV